MAAKTLPHDIIVEILSRLPVKDLLRYRCISKQWCSTIDGRGFIKKHLDRSLETSSNIGVVIRACDLHWLSLDTLDSVVKLSHPIEDYGGTELLGSCDGLLALFNSDEDIALWNPSTKRYRKLPSSDIEFPEGILPCVQFIVYGFGHDPVENDYKLVRMAQFYGNYGNDSFDSEVKVYSAKTNTWTRVRDFPYYLRYKRGYGALASNSLHWVVSRKPESDVSTFIVAVDLATELYHEVPMPDFDHEKFHMNVDVLGGSLCAICNFPSDDRNCDWDSQSKGFDVWLMKEYGIKESWIKLFSIVPSVEIGSFSFVLPVAYLKGDGGNRVLADNGGKNFMAIDLERGKAENLKVYSTSQMMETLVCVESLVGLDGGNGQNGWKIGDEGKKEKKEKKLKKNKKTKHKQKRDDFLSRGFKLVL